jgi:hypothetical protein
MRVPVDGRKQFNGTEALLGSVMSGRLPYGGFEQIGPGRYVLAGSYPMAQSQSPWDGGGSVAAEVPQRQPQSAASAIWPDLPRS